MAAAKNNAFLWAVVPILAADRISKAIAYVQLEPAGIPHPVIGDAFRLVLVFNRDAAMNLTLGPWSRWGFATIAVIGVMVLLRVLRSAPRENWLRGAAVGMVVAGAVGNLLDRLRWDRGVIDFIDIGVGSHRFWTFNVADIGVTVGALLLAWSFSQEHPPTPEQLDV